MVRLFQVSIPTAVVGLLISEALICFGCYALAEWILQGPVLDLYLLEEGGFMRIGVMVACLLLGIYFHDLYSNIRVKAPSLLFAQFLTVMGLGLLFQAVLYYLNEDLVLTRDLLILGSGIGLVVLPLFRVFYSYAAVRILGRQKILFIGDNDLVREIGHQISVHPEKGFVCIGYLSDEPDPSMETEVGKWLGKPESVDEVARWLQPATVVVGLKERRGRLPVYRLMDLRLGGQHVQDASTLHESLTGRVAISTLRPSQLVFSDELGPKPRQVAIKEATSFVIAVLGMVIAAPVMAIVAIIVKLTSPGPALYSQTRVGFQNSTFRVYKFRSMYQDAEARTGAVWASKNDPRITPVGRWLRKLRLDELPQLFNVLRGEMSIVGPRPERPEFVRTLSEQIPFYAQRHFVKPGITGWAQINHKYGDTIEDTISKLEYDLYYLKNLSPWLDLYIIFHTVKVMLLSRGSQ